MEEQPTPFSLRFCHHISIFVYFAGKIHLLKKKNYSCFCYFKQKNKEVLRINSQEVKNSPMLEVFPRSCSCFHFLKMNINEGLCVSVGD